MKNIFISPTKKELDMIQIRIKESNRLFKKKIKRIMKKLKRNFETE